MQSYFLVCLCAWLFIGLQIGWGAAQSFTPQDVSVGRDLQTYATIAFSERAPAEGMRITVSSSDPARLLLAKTPDVAGSESITLIVRAGFKESPEFWLQALSDSGEVTYTVSAPGGVQGAGTVTLSPAGLLIVGPLGDRSAPEFVTTPRGWPTKISVRTARLDGSLRPAEPQLLRGGLKLDFAINISDATVGTVLPSPLHIESATDMTVTHFKPAAVGTASLTITQPPGFRVPAELNSVSIRVKPPGIAVADDMVVGENLQVTGALSLGEPAPPGGVDVTLTSSDPKRLLLSTDPSKVGEPGIRLHLPEGAVTTTYHLQALKSSGTVAHTATAPGYLSRTGTLTFAPSGVILTLEKHGPPDEAELFRPESAGSHRNHCIARLSDRRTPLNVYTAYLDPVTRRSADITVQQLRGGLSLSVDFKNSNAAVGSVEKQTVIKGGSDRGTALFTAHSIGETIISVVTPERFTTPSNATELLVMVQE